MSARLAALASPLGVHDFGATFFPVTVILGVVRAGDRANSSLSNIAHAAEEKFFVLRA